ncbi:hypothetical protein DPEC_G00208060 [Dallia pectoralis]|uniref:Uncharacterized protein n=1 Tax=Dallia pectoralis TaxID=75939 RepID=A0ACC2G5D1_DALPE|nr:hypothetical protein DPEC_G00208060 [Dallia pectoralis]
MSGSEVVYTVVSALIAIICCVGNALVIWAVWSNSSLRQPTFYYIGSLAAADFLVGSVAVPVAVLVDGRVQTSFHTCLFGSCVVVMLTMASVMSLLAISVDRFLRVYIPFRYKKTVTAWRSWTVVVLCWFLAVILSFPPMMGWHKCDVSSQSGNSTSMLCRFIDVIPMSYLVYFVFFLCTLTPLLIMAVLYFYIFCKIQRNLREKLERDTQSHTYFRRERSLARSLALVLVLFAFCWLPLDILNCVAYFANGPNIPQTVFHVGILLSHANSAVNPVIYAFKIRKIQESYLMIYRRLFCRDHNQGSQSSQTTENYLNSNTTNVARNSGEDATAF